MYNLINGVGSGVIEISESGLVLAAQLDFSIDSVSARYRRETDGTNLITECHYSVDEIVCPVETATDLLNLKRVEGYITSIIIDVLRRASGKFEEFDNLQDMSDYAQKQLESQQVLIEVGVGLHPHGRNSKKFEWFLEWNDTIEE